MLSVTIEPGFFAPPFGSRNADSVHRYVSLLLHWTEVYSKGYAEIFTARSTGEVLTLCECYPLRPWLKELLAETSVVDYDANTIASTAEILLGRSRIFEDRSQITDVLTENHSIAPDIFGSRTSASLSWEADRCAIILAILRVLSSDKDFLSHAIVTRSVEGARELSVRAQISLIEHSRIDLTAPPTPPTFFEGRATACEQFGDYVGALDEHMVWKHATCKPDLEKAIRIAIYKSRSARSLAVTWASTGQFRIHDNFLQTARGCGALTNTTLMKSAVRAIVETIEDLSLASTRILRTGSGPENPEQKRGNDVAWRRSIDTEFRLHYWKCEGGVKEISCMVPHNDFSICS